MDTLTVLDYFIFFCVLLLTLISVFIGQKNKTSHDFLDHLLMGRRLTLPLFVATLVATWYGGIFGVAEIAFNEGLYNFLTQGIFWYGSYLVFAFLILPKINQQKHATLANLINSEIGETAGKWASIVNIMNLLPLAYIVSLGKFLNLVFQVHESTGMMIGTAIVLSYSLIGGFRSVVFSDIIQFFVMVTSVVLFLIFSLSQLGLEALNTLPEHYFSFSGKTNSLSETLMWGFIAFGTLVDPNFYQRSYSAKSPSIAQKGILISILVWVVFDISLTLGAMFAASAGSSDYFAFSLSTLPVGLKGFFLAGILATILSTLDSYFFLAGATLSHDYLNKKNIKAQRKSILIIASISLVLALFSSGSIKNIWSTFGSISTAALLSPMLFYYWKGGLGQKTFLISSAAGATTTILAYTYKSIEGYPGLEPIYFGIFASAVLLFIPIEKRAR